MCCYLSDLLLLVNQTEPESIIFKRRKLKTSVSCICGCQNEKLDEYRSVASVILKQATEQEEEEEKKKTLLQTERASTSCILNTALCHVGK